jgi:hypothetical protein
MYSRIDLQTFRRRLLRLSSEDEDRCSNRTAGNALAWPSLGLIHIVIFSLAVGCCRAGDGNFEREGERNFVGK